MPRARAYYRTWYQGDKFYYVLEMIWGDTMYADIRISTKEELVTMPLWSPLREFCGAIPAILRDFNG